MPANTVSVTRPGKWGNPFRLDTSGHYGPAEAVRDYRRSVENNGGRAVGNVLEPPPTTETIRRALSGKNLACYCPVGQPCHADVLLEIANAEEGEPPCPDAR
jgi:hypothetical protein